MKVLHIGKKGSMERFSAPDSFLRELKTVDMYMGHTVSDYLHAAGDADFIVADAIAEIPADLIASMPNLKLIHSEGVAFNMIDTKAAADRGIYVCNSQGMNASAVAEQTILLMLGMLRGIRSGDQAVRSGDQITVKEAHMLTGDLKELADCAVGLVGFGDIAKETARMLRGFHVRDIYYCKRTPLDRAEEEERGVRFLPLKELLSRSDIVSLHLPLYDATRGIAGKDFFNSMKEGSYFVNTARGGLVDDEALGNALRTGRIAMAGLDTINDEPVHRDHPLLTLPDDAGERILFSPHIGGITASSFRRSYAMIWEDIRSAAEGVRPARIVNGL